jgi:ribonuclease G
MKQVVVHCKPDMKQAALLEDGRLVEYDVQHLTEHQKAGSIYLGKVVNVIPGMQAAFVDIGLDKNAFLYLDDVMPVRKEKTPGSKPTITELVTVGQQLMVQVMKEPEGTKGARVSTHFALPGRWLVYMPDAGYSAVSRKIESEEERGRLRRIAELVCSGNEGVIARTVAAGQSEEALQHDLQQLRDVFTGVLAKAETAAAPALLHQDVDLLARLARDVISEDVAEVWVDDQAVCEEIRNLLARHSPGLIDRVKFRSERPSLFDQFGVADEINKCFRRKVWLPSGGYLIIDPTEGLTVIDVNTGKYIGNTHELEETVYRTNLEAAGEIPRLLRLRNIRGIIIVDFIDMSQDSNRSAVLDILQSEVRKDRSKTIVVGWTKLGLIEMTRKRK